MNRFDLISQMKIYLEMPIHPSSNSLFQGEILKTKEKILVHKIKIEYSSNLNDQKLRERVMFIANQRFKYYPSIADLKIQEGYIYIGYKEAVGVCLREMMFKGIRPPEEVVMRIGMILLKGYQPFIKNGVAHQEF